MITVTTSDEWYTLKGIYQISLADPESSKSITYKAIPYGVFLSRIKWLHPAVLEIKLQSPANIITLICIWYAMSDSILSLFWKIQQVFVTTLV